MPPRLLGVGTEDCPSCKELVLSESRLPAGASATVTARFAFDDPQASISSVRAFATAPGGRDGLQTELSGGGFAAGVECEFVTDEPEQLSVGACVVTAERYNNGSNDVTVAQRLRGFERGRLTATYNVDYTEVGEWTIEVRAESSSGLRSNRLTATLDVASDVGDPTPPDTDTDTGTTDTDATDTDTTDTDATATDTTDTDATDTDATATDTTDTDAG